MDEYLNIGAAIIPAFGGSSAVCSGTLNLDIKNAPVIVGALMLMPEKSECYSGQAMISSSRLRMSGK